MLQNSHFLHAYSTCSLVCSLFTGQDWWN